MMSHEIYAQMAQTLAGAGGRVLPLSASGEAA